MSGYLDEVIESISTENTDIPKFRVVCMSCDNEVILNKDSRPYRWKDGCKIALEFDTHERMYINCMKCGTEVVLF